ncbi:MAG TPA: acyl-CoA dehydrogenase [Desulfosarcina sp.]|nr:acyl-CoA dehydrogenase [Desulfosarcina sp.]
MLFNPQTALFDHLDAPSREIMQKTIAFFETKGKRRLKQDDHDRVWYDDFLQFVKQEKIFASLLTPSRYGAQGTRWDTFRNMDFNEILGFYSLAYWYAWQVSILGLGPIWMGDNEAVKHKAARLLEAGGIFAFGLSEKEHGADLYDSDMALTPMGGGRYRADGGKYYIGNGNAAALVSTFGKNSETDAYVFFVVDTRHEHYECVQNLVNSQMYVSEYALHGYPLDEEDILAVGSRAWDASLNTINVGKYNLGWASIGICTHAFYEAIDHAAGRYLFKHYVTDFPHIRRLFVDAYSRLCAMRMFARRASDYMRSASAEDRRYLLYNPMVKMKVTTQGEAVINLLWDVIAAKGFEKDTYFEMAARDIRALPKLEGTVHVNMALIVKFMANYFFNPGQFPDIGTVDAPVNDDFLFDQGPTRGLGKIRFHDYRIAYDSLDLPNIRIFKEQISLLVELLMTAAPDPDQVRDIDFLLTLGELFTLVAYGQLLIEKRMIDAVDDDLMDLIFDFMVRDFSEFALQLYSKTGSTPAQMAICVRMIRKPAVNPERFERIWERHVYARKGSYRMND